MKRWIKDTLDSLEFIARDQNRDDLIEWVNQKRLEYDNPKSRKNNNLIRSKKD